MRRSAHRHHGFARLAHAFLLAGLLLRAAIPAGTMLDYAAPAEGRAPLVLCPAAFPAGLPGPGRATPEGPQAADHRGVLCIFAAVAMLAPPAAAEIIAVDIATVRLPPPVREIRIPRGHHASLAARPRAPPTRLSIHI
ncbi:MAG: hypothetical protein D6807_09565 [Alphaproteobacteria bacterium]|nr:MAG: hypothetical protein D6807_09565 [Alphaproteobacteria bacterium]